MKFFFDTADADYIRNTWAKYSDYVDSDAVLGVTTNPNALSKVNCNSLLDLEKVIKSLTQVLDEIRGEGEIFVQLPNSNMVAFPEVIGWTRYIKSQQEGDVRIGIKIPHYTFSLILANRIVEEFPGISVNVTGIADWAHILKALSFKSVTYASLIPGRMDEAGIDSREHLAFLFPLVDRPKQNIITGSMRTLEGLSDAIFFSTIPTIGTRLWDSMSVKDFLGCWERKNKVGSVTAIVGHGPEVTDKSVKLSEQFFEQMDALGKPIYDEFVRSL